MAQSTNNFVTPKDSNLGGVSAASGLNAARSQVTQPIFTTNASIQAWKAHLAKLSPESKAKFLQYSTGNVSQYTAYLLKAADLHKKGSRMLKINNLIQPFVRTTTRYIGIAAATSQADPYPSSFVIGGIMCVLQISENLSEYQEQIAKWLSKLATKTSILLEFDLCLYQQDDRVQNILAELYGDVLDFCSTALAILENKLAKPHGGARLFGRALKQSFKDKFGPIVESFELHLDQYKDAAQLCDSKRLLQSYTLQINEAQHQRDFRLEQKQFEKDQLLFHEDSRRAYQDTISSVSSVRSAMEDEASLQRAELQRIQDEQDRVRRAEERRRVLDWLPSIDLHDEHDRRCNERQEGTTTWLHEDATYQSWKTCAGSSILWVSGKPGCGKSILATATLNELRENASPGTAVAHFYCSSNDPNRSSVLMLANSLFKEICLQTQDLESNLEALHQERGLMQTQGPGLGDLKTLFPHLLPRFNQIFVLVDGIDECAELDNVLKFLKSLTNVTSGVLKLIVFSRPESNTIQTAFKEAMQLRVDRGANDEDIRTFINGSLSQDEFDWSADNDLLNYVKQELLKKAEGSFVYVSLQLRTLKEAFSRNEVKQRLRSLPADLDKTYELSLQRIVEIGNENRREMALNILIWITNAKRPLSRKELLEAIIIRQGMKDLSEDDVILSDNRFAALYADLVDVSKDGYYQLIHTSLREYLTKLAVQCPNNIKLFQTKQVNAQVYIGQICLTYLLLDTFNHGPVAKRKHLKMLNDAHPFLDYAATYWAHHCHATDQAEFSDLIWRLLHSENARNLTMQVALSHEYGNKFPILTPITPLHVASFYGLSTFAAAHRSLREGTYAMDGLGMLPLDYALLENHHDMCLWLLRECPQASDPVNVEESAASAIHIAIERHWSEVLDELIFRGFDLNHQESGHLRTPLAVAAYNGYLPGLQKLLQRKVSVDARDLDGKTPLILAAELKQHNILQPLLDAGADVNASDVNGMSAIHYATANGALDTVHLLLESNEEACRADKKHNMEPIHWAAKSNSPEIIRALKTHGASLESTANQDLRPIHIAAYFQSLEAAKCLRSLGAEENALAFKGDTLIHIAATGGSVEVINFFLENNNNLELRTFEGSTPLHRTAEKGHSTACAHLLRLGAKVDAQDHEKSTPFLRAVRGGHCDTARLLLTHNASALAYNGHKWNAFHYAAKSGLTDIVSSLVAAEVDLEAQTSSGETGLGLASYRGHNDFLRQLFLAAPDLDKQAADRRKRTALHWAAIGGKASTVQLLLQQGCQQIADAKKNLPVHLAVFFGHQEVAEMLLLRSLIDAQGFWGRTALCIAALRGHEGICDILIKNGAATDTPDDSGNTALMLALSAGEMEIANMLLRHGANMHAIDNDHQTALHFAARQGDPRMIERLIQLGCEPERRNLRGISSFAMAVYSRNVEAVDILLRHNANGPNEKDGAGRTCMDIAAANGDTNMLRKLLSWTEGIGALDAFGDNALSEVVRGGHLDTVKMLLDSGMSPTSPNALTPPLHIAAGFGFTKIAQLLLEKGAPVNHESLPGKTTPVMTAAAHGHTRMVKNLITAGADVLQFDSLGKTASDYAAPHQPTLHVLCENEYVATSEEKKKQIARRTIRELLKRLETRHGDLNLTDMISRMMELLLLARGLGQLQDTQSHAAATEVLTVVSRTINSRAPTWTTHCDACSKSLADRQIFCCVECPDTHLCSVCHALYLKGWKVERSPPQSLIVLEDLEEQVSLVKCVLLPWLELHPVNTRDMIGLFDIIGNWFDSKKQEYHDWEYKYNQDEIYPYRIRPGQQFLKIINECRRIVTIPQNGQIIHDSDDDYDDDVDDDNEKQDHTDASNKHNHKGVSNDMGADAQQIKDPFDVLVKPFRDFHATFHDVEFATNRFTCRGHTFISSKQIDDVGQVKDDEIECKLSEKWISTMLDKYGSFDEDAEDTSIARSAAPAEKEALKYSSTTTSEPLARRSPITDNEGGPSTALISQKSIESREPATAHSLNQPESLCGETGKQAEKTNAAETNSAQILAETLSGHSKQFARTCRLMTDSEATFNQQHLYKCRLLVKLSGMPGSLEHELVEANGIKGFDLEITPTRSFGVIVLGATTIAEIIQPGFQTRFFNERLERRDQDLWFFSMRRV